MKLFFTYFSLIRQKLFRLTLLGNFFQHFDQALYYFMLPLTAPLFFSSKNILLAMLWAHLGLASSILFKPLGAYFFGKIADTHGRIKAVSLSLNGLGWSTLAMVFLPLYSQVGALAGCLFIALRAIQSFFAAGETINSSLILLENASKEKQPIAASFYNLSTILGILFSSICIGFFLSHDTIKQYWRYCYLFGFLTILIAQGIRKLTYQDKPITQPLKITLRSWNINNIRIWVQLSLLSGFGYMCFSMVFIFLPSFFSLITAQSSQTLIQANSLLLILDMFILIGAAALVKKIKIRRLIILCLLLTLCFPFCGFAQALKGSLLHILLIRMFFVLIGASFSVAFSCYKTQLVPYNYRSRILSLSNIIGAQLFGVSSSGLCLGLYYMTNNPWVVVLYTSLLASINLAFFIPQFKLMGKKI